ncbi:TPA: recombinase RecA [bacterium]|nr:recombinase RecA [bacterium]
MSDTKKDASLTEAIKTIQKQYGKGSIMKLGDRALTNVDTISSGSLLLDVALGVGGYPRGRVVEIYGPESSGKTTIALHAVAEAQKNGGRAAFIDAEHAIDPAYAQKLGVNVDELILSQPDSGEQALEIVEILVKSQAIDLIVVDSVAALVPQVELDGEMSDAQVGAQARLMSKALRKITALLNKSVCTIIFINQLREKVGVIYGNPEVTPGGRALKFYSTIRIDVRRGEAIKQGSEIVGNVVKLKVVKNKVAPPFKVANVDLMYGLGISLEGEVIDLAAELEVIGKSGSWYDYNGERLGQGKENVKKYFKENEAIYKEVEQKVKEKLNLVKTTSEE